MGVVGQGVGVEGYGREGQRLELGESLNLVDYSFSAEIPRRVVSGRVNNE